MRSSQGVLSMAATAIVLGGALAFGSSAAMGQTVVAPNGWVTPAPPPAIVVAPTSQAVAPGTVWQGYAPVTNWTPYQQAPYQPQTTWRSYVPQQQGRISAPPTVGRPPVGPRNREFGSGRNVLMHKPWLPNRAR